MADDSGGQSPIRWVVLVVLVLLFAFLAYRFLMPASVPAPEAPAAQSTEWTDEPGGVDVNLPETPMTNPPAESETGDAAGAE